MTPGEVGWHGLLLVDVSHPVFHACVRRAWNTVGEVRCLLSLLRACRSIQHPAPDMTTLVPKVVTFGPALTVVWLGPLPTT